MSFSLSSLRDDFTDNTQSPAWSGAYVQGSATKAETGGQAVLTLPSNTAGSHVAAYRSAAVYDLTGDGFVWNIGTMVATGVAAEAYFQLFYDTSYQLLWRQVSNAITARIVDAGVDSQLYTATWSGTTYKYLRIREASGTIYWDSSSNGTSWTNRASSATPFLITELHVQFAAVCGNVASPGSLKLDDVNLILPAPSSTWRETTADWSITNRLRPVTLASDGGKQGVIVTADAMDSSRVLSGNLRYFAGPLGSTSGGYLALTEYASLATAQASAFPIPVDGRVDLPALVDARYMRLYHRSTDASAHTIYEYVPRRIVQADDIEAESIKAINIAAGAITADKIFVISLAAITATMGALHMTGVIDIATAGGIYQGTGTFASPTTGLKLFNSGGVGKLSGYNAGVEQITLDTDGKLKAGAGSVVLDATGLRLAGADVAASRVKWSDAGAGGDFTTLVGAYASNATGLYIRCDGPDSGHPNAATITLLARNYLGSTRASAVLDGLNSCLRLNTGLYVGTSTGPSVASGSAQISGTVGIGIAPQTTTALLIHGVGATGATSGIYYDNSGSTAEFYVTDAGVGYLNNTAWTYASDATKKRNIRALGRDILHLMQLKPVRFDYIDGPADRMGFIAQDVQAVFPELVEVMADGALGMRTDELLPVMLHAFKRLVRLLITKNLITAADVAGVEPEP